MLKSHLEVIDQALDLLNEMDDVSFQHIFSPYFSGSIGQHLRHVVDHYTNLLDGFNSGLINYNKRHRFSPIESSIDVCTAAFEEVKQGVAGLLPEQLAQSVAVLTEISISEHDDALVQSNLERELVFASSHAIHHYALIKIIRQMQDATVPDTFGFAPATLSYMRAQAG
jgi:uncharacterized damage-inducible protein DinB